MRQILASFLIFFSLQSFALEEVGIYGEVTDARPYYQELVVPQVSGQSRIPSPNEKRIIDLASRNASYDSGLVPGNIKSRKLSSSESKYFVASICIVANDKASHSWLSKNMRIIKENVSLCYLANSDASSDARDLSSKYPGIRFFDINPKFIVDKFNLVKYPVLISKRGIEQ